MGNENWVSEFAHGSVAVWKAAMGDRPRTAKLLTSLMDAIGGTMYAPDDRTANLTITEDVVTGRSAREYAVELVAEHDGVWVVKHSRPSGRWDRKARATSPSTRDHQAALRSFNANVAAMHQRYVDVTEEARQTALDVATSTDDADEITAAFAEYRRIEKEEWTRYQHNTRDAIRIYDYDIDKIARTAL